MRCPTLLRVAALTAAVFPTLSRGAPGDLDPTFGTAGVATLPIAVHSYANAVAIQTDGKILLAGYAFATDPGGMAVVRLDSAGVLDPTFGSGGVVTLPAGVQSLAYAVLVQPDDKIVVAGGAFTTPDCCDYDFRLARLLPADGQLDPGFGSGGIVLTPSAGTIGAISLAFQPDGKILAGGDGKRRVESRGLNRDFVVVRYLADGTLDPGFGEGGRATVSMGRRYDIARTLLLQPDGAIVAAGYSTGRRSGRMALARLDTGGLLDDSFGRGGRLKLRLVTRREYAQDAALLADGRIVAAGLSVDPRFPIPPASVTLARLTSGGGLDPSFGTDGVSSVAPYAGAYHLVWRTAIQTDGKIVGVGEIDEVNETPDVFLARFLADGSLDASFGTGGVVRTAFTSQDELFAVALQPDGNIVVAGVSVVGGQSRMLVARYLP